MKRQVRKCIKVLNTFIFILGLVSIIMLSSESLHLLNVIRPYDKLNNYGMDELIIAKYIPSPSLQYLLMDGIVLIDFANFTISIIEQESIIEYDYFRSLSESKFNTFNAIPELTKEVKTKIYNAKNKVNYDDNILHKVIEEYIENLKNEMLLLSILALLELHTIVMVLSYVFNKFISYLGLDTKFKNWIFRKSKERNIEGLKRISSSYR